MADFFLMALAPGLMTSGGSYEAVDSPEEGDVSSVRRLRATGASDKPADNSPELLQSLRLDVPTC